MAKHQKNAKKNNLKQKKIPKSRLKKTGELSGNFNEQTFSRKEREIMRLTNLAKGNVSNNKMKKKRNSKNRLTEETAKLGYFQKPWEDVDQLVHRFFCDSSHAVKGELLKAKFGAAGRDSKEIDRDYKELDAKEAQKKMQKKTERENLKKAKVAKDALPLKKKLGKNEKMRLKQKELRKIENYELLFNAREIVPFGERVDAPPQFVNKFRDSINQARVQAGKMNLLLKEVVK